VANGTNGTGLDVAGTDAGGRDQRVQAMRVDVRLWVAEAAATWLVRRAFEIGYRGATGRDLPTARDRSAPLRRVLVWTAATAAGVAIADAVVDRVVLRSQPLVPLDVPASEPSG